MRHFLGSVLAAVGGFAVASNLHHPAGTAPAMWAGVVWTILGILCAVYPKEGEEK